MNIIHYTVIMETHSCVMATPLTWIRAHEVNLLGERFISHKNRPGQNIGPRERGGWWQRKSSSNELRSKLCPSKNPCITFPAESSNVNKSEAVIGITRHHKHKAEKAFLIKEVAATVAWLFDADMFAVDRSDAIRVVPLRPESTADSLPLFALWKLYLVLQPICGTRQARSLGIPGEAKHRKLRRTS